MSAFVQSPPIGFLLDVVNTWAEDVYHDAAPPRGRSYPSLALLGDGYAVHIADEVVDEGRLTTVAAQYYQLFTTDQPTRVALANELIKAADLRPRLTKQGLAWVGSSELWVEGLLAAALIEHAERDTSLDRFGCCTAHGCRDAFIDNSQGNTRTFCAVRCQNRAKARRRRSASRDGRGDAC